MKFTNLGIDGAGLAESNVYSDNRGSFSEFFKSDAVKEETGISFEIKQGNVSVSNRGVIRGIHYSLASEGQAKWATCVQGHVLDVIIDIRPNSATFKKKVMVDLKAGEGRAVLIGTGLGHGFIALEDDSIFTYLLTSGYSPSEEFEINPMDREINIDWNLDKVGGAGIILSPKDANAPSLAERLSEGKLPN